MPQMFPMSWVMIYLSVLGLFVFISLLVSYYESWFGGEVSKLGNSSGFSVIWMW
uniref:ATP synthase F0 subunit 8 n=1 Tax=Xystodesmus sp. YD-2016 TaxID=1904352 RepID=A0A1S5RS93_9MYRI|nr:ATP synthase F0 subunit 8 [Xystodesmus sp. YD-2016]